MRSVFGGGGEKKAARLHLDDTSHGAFDDGSLICRRRSAQLTLKGDLDKLVFLSHCRLMSLPPRLQAGDHVAPGLSLAGCEQHLFAFRVTFTEKSGTPGDMRLICT